MSWVQWQGEIWPATKDEAEMRIFLDSPDSGRGQREWNWDLMHLIRPENAGPEEYDDDVGFFVEISDLNFHEHDWRKLGGLEIRADARWHESQEYVNECSHLRSSQVSLATVGLPAGPGESGDYVRWLAHDFTLRIGAREGWSFPCELDAWMILETEYYRQEPESDEEVALFAQGPPNLRVITRATFVGGSIDLARCAGDPVAVARRRLREEVGCEEIYDTRLKWMLRQTPGREEIVGMPGWRSTVHFSTRERGS